MKNSGKIIRGLRDLHNWSQSDLGKLAGISKSQVSQIETGHRHPGRKIRAKLAQAFAMSEDDFALLLQSRGEEKITEIWSLMTSLPHDSDILFAILDILRLAHNKDISSDFMDMLTIHIRQQARLASKIFPPKK